jgi:protein-S-isoprenylcysteine O-methyltransferase Ste14
MIGALAFSYGVVCYGVFFASFLYAMGFLADAVVPKGIDGGAPGGTAVALAVDLALLGLFAVQHSGMARRGFKRWWTRVVSPAVERSTYVLFSSLVLLLLFWQWRPIAGAAWRIEDGAGRAAVWALYALGWLTVLGGTFMISHAHLFGLSQVKARLRGESAPEPVFQTRWLYRRIRHPLMVGFLVAFWAAPTMTWGHLLFAAAATGYILIATLALEERDLARHLGEPYRRYRRQVPAFVPWPGRRAG